MRKVAVLAALMIAVALPTTSNAAAKKKEDPVMAAQTNTSNFMRAAMNPYEATKPAPAKKGKKK